MMPLLGKGIAWVVVMKIACIAVGGLRNPRFYKVFSSFAQRVMYLSLSMKKLS